MPYKIPALWSDKQAHMVEDLEHDVANRTLHGEPLISESKAPG